MIARLISLLKLRRQSGASAQAGFRARPPRLAWDHVIIVCTSALLLIGLVMVASASISIAARQNGDPFFYLERQLGSAVAGILVAWYLLYVPIETWERYGLVLLSVAFMGLVLVLVPGVGAMVNGSRRWLRIGFFNFQWSEAARMLLLLWLAGYLVRRQEEVRSTLIGFAKPMGLLFIAFALLISEPDMGAAVVLMGTAFLLTYLAGARLLYCAASVVLGAVVIIVGVVTSAYRMKRVVSFTRPFEHALDSGYQLVGSLIAIGRGEFFGVGLGDSAMTTGYLPEAHTDFVFAVLAEEFGFLGIVVVLALFMVLALRCLLLSRRAMLQGKKFHAYVAAAFGIWIGMQALVNMAVTMGMVPTKGLTLPLLSYGRSSLLVVLAWIGLMLRIHHEVVGVSRTVTRSGSSFSRSSGSATNDGEVAA